MNPRAAATPAAAIALVVLVAVLGSPNTARRTSEIVIFAVAFSGLHVLSGRLGLISIGHAAFMGIGALAAAHAVNDLGAPFVLVPILAAVGGAVAGALVAVPSLRLPGTYLALLTLAVAMALPILMRRIDGPLGVVVDHEVTPPSWTGLTADQAANWQLLVITAAAVVFAIPLVLALTSRFGRSLLAVRDEPIAATAFGIPVARVQVLGVALACAIAGFAGGLRIAVTPYVAGDIYPFELSLAMFALLVAFGGERLWPAIPAGMILVLLPEALREAAMTEYEPIAYGVVLLVMTRVSGGEGLTALLERRPADPSAHPAGPDNPTTPATRTRPELDLGDIELLEPRRPRPRP